MLHCLQGPIRNKRIFRKGREKQHGRLWVTEMFQFSRWEKTLERFENAIWLLPASVERSKEKRRGDWVLFHGLLSLQQEATTFAAALSPWSKADTHPLSARSTDCHSSCQSSAIVPRSPRAAEERRKLRMEEDDDEGLRRGGGEKAKSLGKKTDEAEADYMHHRCQLDLGFNISISIRETEARQGIEKHNLRHAFHVGLLWSPSAFRQQKWRRRGEGEKAAKEGIRSSFDSFFPFFFFVYSSTPLHHGIHQVPSEPVIWQ